VASPRGNRRRTVLILLILISVTVITLDSRGGNSGIGGTVRNTARDVFAPVQDGVDSALAPIGDWWDGVTKAGDIKAENRRLRRELQAARGQVAAARSSLRDIRDLRTLSNLPWAEGLTGVNAEIILGSPGNFESTVGLDKGSDAGIAPDHPVVSGAGLLGRVGRVSGKRATVVLLTDRESGVVVRDTNTNQRGVINGRGETGVQTLDNIDGEGTMKPGDLLVTAGVESGPYPPGIPVARIVSVRKRPGDLLPRVTVKLLADASTTEFVRVLEWPTP
jgi:rod shape-determining protein MreC